VALNDPLLAPLIRADETSAEAAIERLLIDTAQPLIQRVLTRYAGAGRPLSMEDAEDLAGTVQLRLLLKLRRLRTSAEDAVENFAKYVAMVAYHAVHDLFRTRFPQRNRLRNRLYYTAVHDSRFSLWPSADGPVCGLRAWKSSDPVADEVLIEASSVTSAMRDRDHPADALQAVFTVIGRPVLLDVLVPFLAALWHVIDLVPLAAVAIPSSEPAVTERLEWQQYLGVLWKEIQELRPLQRKALLLNLRDGGTVNVLSLLVRTGTASFNDVAAALEMHPGQLAAIWDDLPIGDLRIAELLRITRQQVINLRKSARERLNRRMGR
jgi:hypothetical protein